VKPYLWPLLLLAACTTTQPPAPAPEDFDDVIILCERAVFATAQRNPARREDFQSTFDILDVMLDDLEFWESPPMTRADLVSALSWMKTPQLDGPDGSIILKPNDVYVQQIGQPVRSISDAAVEPVGNAVWVALNRYLYPVSQPEPEPETTQRKPRVMQ